MDEVLKRRLTGALVLLLCALLLGFLLPRPGPAPLDEGLRRVTLDLDAPAPAPEPEPVVLAETSTPAQMPAAEAAPASPPTARAAAPAPAPASAPAAAPAATPPRPGPVRIRPSEQLAATPADAADGKTTASATPPLQLKSAERLSRMPPAEPAPVPERPSVKSAPPPDSGKDAAVATRTPPAAVAEATAPASGRWSVQIGSFSEPANAQQVETRLKAAGLPCTVTLIDTPKGKLHRVRISPLPGEAAARAAHERAVQLGFAAATVRQD